MTDEEPILSDRQNALRDNQPKQNPNEGLARQRRIDGLQNNLAQVQDFIADCDRVYLALVALDLNLTYPDAKQMTENYVLTMKDKAKTKAAELKEELQFLRNLQ